MQPRSAYFGGTSCQIGCHRFVGPVKPRNGHLKPGSFVEKSPRSRSHSPEATKE